VDGELVSRDEVTATLFAIADINASSAGSSSCSKEAWMARSGRRKTTREEWARWRETEARLERVLARRLAADGTTKDEVLKRLRDAK
jgi:uncharacterized alpha-E superfamily protein